MDPERAQAMYLKHKQTECVEKTVRTHRYRTNYFVEWCAENDIENLNELSGRDLQAYRLWREENGDLKKISLNQQMSTIRVFLQWCASVEAVPANLYEKVMVPRVSPEEERREETLELDTAEEILGYLSQYHYASVEHVILALLWETGIRSGATLSLDVDDFDPAEERIDLVHRPDEGTRLKNAKRGERPIALSESLTAMLRDYIEANRYDATDDYGREPLIATAHGRMSTAEFRRNVYKVTSPCYRGAECKGCVETTKDRCPGAVSPHSVRTGSITHFLTKDVPFEVISDRMDVSRKVLDKHYDRRSEDVKLEQRRGYLDDV